MQVAYGQCFLLFAGYEIRTFQKLQACGFAVKGFDEIRVTFQEKASYRFKETTHEVQTMDQT